MIGILNISRNMGQRIPENSLIKQNKYFKLIDVLRKNNIENTNGLIEFIMKIYEMNEWKESIKDLSGKIKQIQDICNKLLETINKKEYLVDQESQLDKEINQVIERKLDIVSNGLGKTESLILQENQIINVRQQLDEIARSVDNSMKGIYTDLNLGDSYIEVLNDQNSDIQKNIITNRINQKLGVLITKKNYLIKQLNKFADKLKIDTSDIDEIYELIKDFISNSENIYIN